MNLTELQTSVYSLTNRPDLVGQTLLAVQAAVLKLHQSDYFYKDLFETGVVFSTAEYLQQLDYRILIPTFRSLKYLRKTDSTGTDDLGFFEIIQPESVLDDYSINREDVCYAAGASLQIRSSTEFQYALLGCYVNPNITTTGFNSWIALDHPFAIIYEAASEICRQIGKQEEIAYFKLQAAEQARAIAVSNIQLLGY